MKRVFGIVWAGLFVAFLAWWVRSDLRLEEVPAQLDAWLGAFGLLRAGALYVVFYTLRPLVLFPASILTIAAGLIFGPWLGIAFTAAGENASANFAFLIARWVGQDWVQEHEHGTVRRWERKISENGLVSVLIMRLIYLPFDAVSYGCGLTSMRQRDFFLGTFLGIVPGMVSFVLFGGSAAARVENRALVFGSAVFFFVLGLLLARWLRARSPAVDGPLPPRAVGDPPSPTG